MMKDTIRKTIIIGSGPAGYTAAIYTGRANLEPLLITGKQPGGQLITTSEVENFPGYPKGTDGPAMMEDFREQAERFGTEVIQDSVARVEFNTSQKYIAPLAQQIPELQVSLPVEMLSLKYTARP